MDQAAFDQFAAVLARRVARDFPGTHLFVAVYPPGSFEGKAGPFTASTLPAVAQPLVLRALADSFESNAPTEILRVEL